jgi:hypothetical protein
MIDCREITKRFGDFSAVDAEIQYGAAVWMPVAALWVVSLLL